MLIVLQGQVLAFDLAEGLAAAGYITLAVTLTRYADRVDRILAATIYPAICAVQDRPATLAELFAKSNRLALAWVVPFCGGLVLFAPDLVEFVLGTNGSRPSASSRGSRSPPGSSSSATTGSRSTAPPATRGRRRSSRS